jgi:EpsI family protein
MSTRRTALGLMLGMVGSVGLAAWARPTILESDSRRGLKLDELIPAAFAGWTIDRNVPVVVPPPDQLALMSKIYNQTLARTYVNADGYRIMLSLAYGGDQSDGLTVHLPEICYVGQGFALVSSADGRMTLGGLTIPVRRLVTVLGPRNEPITYWVTHGDEATISSWRRRLISIRYGLRRQIPDGMLVRVSSIDRSQSQAFEMQQKFLVDLVAALSPAGRDLVLGSVSAPPDA